MWKTIRELLDREPFVSFEIVMTSGDRFNIENPALVAAGESELTYCLPRSNSLVHLRPNQIALVIVKDLPA